MHIQKRGRNTNNKISHNNIIINNLNMDNKFRNLGTSMAMLISIKLSHTTKM